MSRRRKWLLVFAGVALGFFLLVLGFVGVGFMLLTSGDETTAQEIPVTEERREQMRSAGYPVTLLREFEVSSYNGFNGDGLTINANLFPAREAADLVAALKQKLPDHTWGESSVGSAVSGTSLLQKLPVAFWPAGGAAPVLAGGSTNQTLERIAVDRTNGVLYFISWRM